MANYHLEILKISRGIGRSIVRTANYITGEKLCDKYNEKTYCYTRNDVLFSGIFLPANAPTRFHQLQTLCDEIDRAENRYDARTAREFIGSLPNELSLSEQKQIVKEYITHNFVEHGLCAIAAIHEGKNISDPAKNNPHVHILVSTRTVGPDGFSKKKDREHNNKKYIGIWREEWAKVQNRAYEKNGYDIRVSHESLEVQGIDREPTLYLKLSDWQREQRGERTDAGDKKRDIEKRNRERAQQHNLELQRGYEWDLSR